MKKNIIMLSVVLGLIALFFCVSYTIELNGEKIKIDGTTYAITIDGVTSDSIPLDGNYYLDSYVCENNSIITWDYYEHDLYIEKIKTNGESCLLNFKSGNLPLAKMQVGDYVAYVGNNGCLSEADGTTGTGDAESGNSCKGYNANQPTDGSVDEKGKYGYCYKNQYHYVSYGWRIAYIEDNKVHLISAGCPECISRPYEENESSPYPSDSISMSSSSSYYYGTTYSYDGSTGTFTLSGSTTSGVWSSIYSDVISTYKYTCKKTTEAGTCTTLYELTGYNSATSASGNAYYNVADANSTHISLMNTAALDYCNATYIDGGVCPTTVSENNAVRALGNTDFEKITSVISGTTSSLTSVYGSTHCNNLDSYERCGYGNDMFDIGGYYWFAAHNINPNGVYWFTTDRGVSHTSGTYAYGFRPIIRLSSSVYVTGGSGTMDDPYTIGID